MIWLKLWPYLLGALVFGSLGAWGATVFDDKRYAALDLQYANYRTQSTEAALKAQDAARMVLEQQIEQTHKVTLNNQATLHDLETQTAAIAADRDRSRELVRRLLAAASRPAASGGQLPEARDRPATPEASQSGSAVDVRELLVNAAAECRGNAARLNSLIAEIRPQL